MPPCRENVIHLSREMPEKTKSAPTAQYSGVLWSPLRGVQLHRVAYQYFSGRLGPLSLAFAQVRKRVQGELGNLFLGCPRRMKVLDENDVLWLRIIGLDLRCIC